MAKTFLQAEWRKLAIANYTVDTSCLLKYLPSKTELELWNDVCYVSLVGFMFRDTKFKSFKIPFHINFEEVNLRFYVRHFENGTWKRGVVFIKEIVPRPAITFIANSFFNEKYETRSMNHSWIQSADTITVAYKWKNKRWNSITVTAHNNLLPVESGSEEEFITEHYWGYTKISGLKSSEYGVEHPRWEVYPTKNYKIDVDFERNYGPDFSFLKYETPKSVFLAEGSLVKVKTGKPI